MPKLYRDAAAARHETPDVAELRRLRDTEREELHSPTRRLDAYYYSFNETGSVPIDAILSAVAIAGKSCHNTDMWTEDDEWSRWGVGRSLVDVIQCAANEAAAALLDAAAERDRLARLLDEPRRSGCAVEIAGVRIAPCDERGQTADMRERDTLADRLAHMREARDNARAERDALAADADKWQRAALTLQGDRDALTDERDSLSWQVEALRAERDARSSERDALAAKVERVRALPAKHPAGGWYMTSMRDVLAALDEEPQP